MKINIQAFCKLIVLSALAIATSMASAQQPCDHLIGEAQIAQHEGRIKDLSDRLLAAYESGDKKQQEDLVKQMEGYTKHREVTFSDDEKNKMEELAQRPEVKMIIEAVYLETRAEDTERAHNYNLAAPGCVFYDNPMLQDYVNRVGQSLVPRTSQQSYAFRIVNSPGPDAWALSTGSIYITTGLMSMLDNEAQLTYVLAHEIGHVDHGHAYAKARGQVLEELLEVEKEKSIRKKGLILGAVAAGLGSAIGGAKGGGSGAAFGATLGIGGAALATALVERLRVPKFTNYSSVQEADADEFAAHTVLEHNFDVREAPKVFLTMENSIHRDDRVGMGFHYGQVTNLVERRQHVQDLVAGALKADLDKRSRGGLQTSSPDFNLLMSAVKRDNGVLAFEYDLFDEARQNLEEAIAVRSNDPRSHYWLGKIYKQTAHTSDEEKKAMDHLGQAIRLDEARSSYERPHLERALALLKQSDQTVLPEAQQEIKTYIELYKLNHGGQTPGNMYILYDYLSLTGDDKWSEPPVLNVVQTQKAALAPSVDLSKADTRRIDAKKK
jgi:predicted Zn-dependent protease